jgi:hypothetical protein
MESDQVFESIKFLLDSVSKLSDRFVENKANIVRSFEGVSRSFEDVCKDIQNNTIRIQELELKLQNLYDQQLLGSDLGTRKIQLPIKPDQNEILIPALNLPLNSIVDVYRNTPALLHPFARCCSVSGRTLSGAIAEIELEAFAQGTTWIIETQDGESVLLPRPGIIQRQTHVDSLSRFFDIAADAQLPAELELLNLGVATIVEYGRRWYLKEKGLIGINSDPLQSSLEQRLRILEAKLNERG